MGTRTRTWVSLLATATLAGIADEIVFAPEPGTKLERRWSETLRLEVDSLEETLGGNAVNVPFDRIEFEERRAFEVADELTRSDGGRPVDLKREFTASSLALALRLDGNPVGHVEGRHACDDGVVRFVYDPDEEEYTREQLEGDIDEDRLQELEPDLDLLPLLPAGEVDVGAEWELEPAALRRFFSAGGGLGFEAAEVVPEMAGAPSEILVAGALGSVHELFGPGTELSGTAKASYAKQDEGEGLARLEVELDLQVQADLGERFRSMLGSDALASTHRFRVGAEVEGTLVVLWDRGGRHLRSARFEGDVTMTGHLVFPLRLFEGAEPQEFVGDYELSGEAEVELAVE